jgi:ribonuclease G
MSKRVKWFFKYWKWVNLLKDSALPLASFKFYNRHNEELELQQ